MGLRTQLRRVFGRSAPVTEAAAAPSPPASMPTAAQVRRAGYEYGISLYASGNASSQVAAGQERQQVLNQLHQLYMTCNWVSAPIDVIARTVTAGGLQLVSTQDTQGGDTAPDPPPVARLKRLMRFCNPREDMVQLLRNAVTDLQLFGDAYLEVVTLLGEPVALYGLDATTMTVLSDLHGEVTGYVQNVDGVRQAKFDPDQVIHISLDAPRGGLYGVGPAQKMLLPATAWLFVMATLKECFRRGDPPRLHVDLAHFQDTEVQRWREQYIVNNLGPRNVGTPVITTGGGQVGVLDPRKVTDYLDTARQLRDEIISGFGTPPAKLGIIETGNLGGGTGEAQDKTFRVNTIIPIAALILEKLNYHLVQYGFDLSDWQLQFAEIDMRDSKVVEEIRDIRLRNGSYTLNRYRDEIGEPAVDGGDLPILVEHQGVVAWDDMEDMSRATIGRLAAGLSAAGLTSYVPGLPEPDRPDPPPMLPLHMLGQHPAVPPASPEDDLVEPDDTEGEPPVESRSGRDQRVLSEAWNRAYRARRRQALRDLPEREKIPA